VWDNELGSAITLRVTDDNGNGIAGKTCSVAKVFKGVGSGGELDKRAVRITLLSKDDQEPLTGRDGFITLNLALAFWPVMQFDPCKRLASADRSAGCVARIRAVGPQVCTYTISQACPGFDPPAGFSTTSLMAEVCKDECGANAADVLSASIESSELAPVFKLQFSCEGVMSSMAPEDERFFVLRPESIPPAAVPGSVNYQQKCVHLVTEMAPKRNVHLSSMAPKLDLGASIGSPKLKAVDLFGEPVPNTYITYQVVQPTKELSRESVLEEDTVLHEVGSVPSKLSDAALSFGPRTFMEGRVYGNRIDYVQSGADGTAQFDNRVVLRGAKGTMLLQFVAITLPCTDCTSFAERDQSRTLELQLKDAHVGMCKSEVFEIHVDNTIALLKFEGSCDSCESCVAGFASEGCDVETFSREAECEPCIPCIDKMLDADSCTITRSGSKAAKSYEMTAGETTKIKLQAYMADGTAPAAGAQVLADIIGFPKELPQAIITGTACVNGVADCTVQDVWAEKAAFYETWASYVSAFAPVDEWLPRAKLFRLVLGTTDADGKAEVSITPYQDAQGYSNYAFTFNIHGVFSPPIVVDVRSSVAALELIAAPSASSAAGFNGSLTERSTLVGDLLDDVNGGAYCQKPHCCADGTQCPYDGTRAVVKVLDEKGTPVEGVHVDSVFWKLGTAFDAHNLMWSTYIGNNLENGDEVRVPATGDMSMGPSHQVYGLRRSMPSDANGLAHFHMLLPLMAETGCYKMGFFARGTPGSSTQDDPYGTGFKLVEAPNPLCFENDGVMTLKNEPSVTAVLGKSFKGPEMRIVRRRGRASEFEELLGKLFNKPGVETPLPMPYFLAVHTILSNEAYASGAITNSEQLLVGGSEYGNHSAMKQQRALEISTRGLLSNHGCLYGHRMRGHELCNVAYHPNTSLTQMSYDVEFASVVWNRGFRGDKLKLTFAPFLAMQYCGLWDSYCENIPSWLAPDRQTTGWTTLDDTPTSSSIISRVVPSYVTVGEVFQVIVFVGSGSTQTPLPYRQVTASVQAAAPANLDPNTFFASQGQPNAAALGAQAAKLLGAAPAKLDERRLSAMTDVNGIAKINLRITEGSERMYTFQFAHGQVKSKKSEQFKLHNPVSLVNVTYSGFTTKVFYEKDFPVEIEIGPVEVAVLGPKANNATLNVSNYLKKGADLLSTNISSLNYATGYTQGASYQAASQVDDSTPLFLLSGHEIKVTFEPVKINEDTKNLSQFATAEPDTCDAGAEAFDCQMKQLSSVAATFVGGAAGAGGLDPSGAATGGVIHAAPSKLALDTSTLTYRWGSDGKPHIKLVVKKAGTYRIIGLVDGIASNFILNEDIVVRSQKQSANDKMFTKLIIKVVMLLLFASLLVGNASTLSNYWVYWSLLAAICFHGLLQDPGFTNFAGIMQSDLEKVCVNMSFPFIYAALLVVAVWQSATCISRKFTPFSDEKFEAFEAYTREILSAPKQGRVKYDQHGNLVNTLDTSDYPTTLHTRTMMPNVSAEDVLAHIARQKARKLQDLERKYTTRKGSAEKNNKVAPNLDPPTSDGADAASLVRTDGDVLGKVEDIYTGAWGNLSPLLFPDPGSGLERLPGGVGQNGAPGQTILRTKLLINECRKGVNPDAFFFPSRLLTGYVISILMVGPMFTWGGVRLSNSMRDSLKASITKAKEQIVQFVRQGIIAYQAQNNLPLPGADIDANVLTKLQKFFTAGIQLADAIPIAMAIALTLSWICILFSWLYLATDFRHTVLAARRGQFDFCDFYFTKPRRFWNSKIFKASDFPILMAWNYVMSLILLTTVFFIPVIVLSWRYTGNILIGFLQSSAFSNFVITFLVNAFLIKMILLKKYCLNKDGIINRAMYSYWDLYNFVAKIYLGIITGLLRVIMGTVAALCTLCAINIYCMPGWFPALLDAGYYAYMMMVLEYHTFNNPIARVALSMMERGAQSRKHALVVVTQEAGSKSREVVVSPKRWRWALYWRLLLLLHKSPQLIRFRSHHLLVLMEREWKEKRKDEKKSRKEEAAEQKKKEKEEKKEAARKKKEANAALPPLLHEAQDQQQAAHEAQDQHQANPAPEL
jgi:hypothetical protein